jgi:exopolysaccharide biosynthesis protein
VHGDSIARVDESVRAREVTWAFQSYPTLLAGGEVPAPLRAPGRGVDLGHRDARLAIGTTTDGQVLVALTRFDALGGRLSFVPFGLTVPEMAALMGALGATDAVMLDGGISAQMLVRDAKGRPKSWAGLRAVPLALVAVPRR